MKLLLFALFFAFSLQAKAADDELDISAIVGNVAPSVASQIFSDSSSASLAPRQVTSSQSRYCVQRNNCSDLGYKETSCPYGGISCPFDRTKLSCSTWSCPDLGLFETNMEGMDCEPVDSGNGVTCFKCLCRVGYIDPQGCDGLVDSLMHDKDICAELGYEDNVTDCADYLPCPSDVNKVHCLDENRMGCEESSCLSQYKVPDHAQPIMEEKECDCGGKKKVIVGWICDRGYTQKEGTTYADGVCVESKCPSNQFESKDDLKDCSTNFAEGWLKVEGDIVGGGKQCYKCVCTVPSDYIYDIKVEGQYEKYEIVACDGEHYASCKNECPSGFNQNALPKGSIPVRSTCEACGEKRDYIADWICDEGWVKNATETACDKKPCPGAKDGMRYSIAYKSLEDCNSIYGESSGWIFEADGPASGYDKCGICKCPYGEDDGRYQFSERDTTNQEDATLSNLGCNNKYEFCTPREDLNYVSSLPENIAPAPEGYDTRKVCGETYYQLNKCETGWRVSDDGMSCVPYDCAADGYIIPNECPEPRGECDPACISGGQKWYRLRSCISDEGVYYVINSAKTACCKKTCDDEGYRYDITECPAGQTLVDTKTNGCGEPCIKCQ